jgi:hypothetical protein
MLLHFSQQGTESDTSRAQVAVRLLGEFRHLKASTIIKTVSDIDRLWPAEPGYVIERVARERLRVCA